MKLKDQVDLMKIVRKLESVGNEIADTAGLEDAANTLNGCIDQINSLVE